MLVKDVNGKVRLARKLLRKRASKPESMEEGSRLLDCSAEDWHIYKNGVALAHDQGEIGTEDALAMQSILGFTPYHFNRQDLAAKYVVTGLMAKMLDWQSKLTLCP